MQEMKQTWRNLKKKKYKHNIYTYANFLRQKIFKIRIYVQGSYLIMIDLTTSSTYNNKYS